MKAFCRWSLSRTLNNRAKHENSDYYGVRIALLIGPLKGTVLSLKLHLSCIVGFTFYTFHVHWHILKPSVVINSTFTSASRIPRYFIPTFIFPLLFLVIIQPNEPQGTLPGIELEVFLGRGSHKHYPIS